MAKTTKSGKQASASKQASNTGVRTTSSGSGDQPPTLKESLKSQGENAGTKHARGRHGATPKQSGSGGSAQYIRRSL